MPLTLDIGSKSIKVLLSKGNRVEKWGAMPVAAGFVKDGLILEPQALGTAIDDFLKSLQIPKSPTMVTVTGIPFTYRVLVLPRLKAPLMDEAILRTAKKELSLSLEDVYITWQVIGGNKEDVEIFVVGVRRDFVDAIVQTMEFAGTRPITIDLKVLSIARAVGLSNALVANLDADSFDIVVVTDGMPTVLHTAITRGETAIIEDNLKRFGDELSRTVDFNNIIHADHPILPATPLFISGQFASDPDIVKAIQGIVEFPVRVLTTSMKQPSDFPFVLYAGNIGLMKKDAGQGILSGQDGDRYRDINIDLLAGLRRTKEKPISTGQRIMPLVVIFAALLFAGAFWVNIYERNERTRLQGEVDALSSELNLARARADVAAGKDAVIKALTLETDSLRQETQNILRKDTSEADVIGMILSSLPSQTDCSLIHMTAQEAIISGETTGKSRITSYAEALTGLGLFTEVRISSISDFVASDNSTKLSFDIVIKR
jgi:hypothetical protein